VLFGGVAKDRPYPGSTIVTAHNGGVSALVRTLAIEIAPHRLNASHPGVVGDRPSWRHVSDHPAIARTPTGWLVTMAEVAVANRVPAHQRRISAGPRRRRRKYFFPTEEQAVQLGEKYSQAGYGEQYITSGTMTEEAALGTTDLAPIAGEGPAILVEGADAIGSIDAVEILGLLFL
jgi:hypothetical protein